MIRGNCRLRQGGGAMRPKLCKFAPTQEKRFEGAWLERSGAVPFELHPRTGFSRRGHGFHFRKSLLRLKPSFNTRQWQGSVSLKPCPFKTIQPPSHISPIPECPSWKNQESVEK